MGLGLGLESGLELGLGLGLGLGSTLHATHSVEQRLGTGKVSWTEARISTWLG